MSDKPQNNFMFRMMSLFIGFRNLLHQPRNLLKEEVSIEPGFHVLDYGCGPGGHAIAAAELAGSSGKVYALDIHPLAVKKVQKIIDKNGLANIKTIQSDCATGLESQTLDVVLLYDIFHMLSDQDGVLTELHRVLKPEGTLSFSDHHMQEEEILTSIEGSGLFKLSSKGKRFLNFVKNGGNNGRKRKNT
jgi:ubiquinone/menaquinone biosynthesis C-methylase UbiE